MVGAKGVSQGAVGEAATVARGSFDEKLREGAGHAYVHLHVQSSTSSRPG